MSYAFSGRVVGSAGPAPRVDEGRPEVLDELEIAFAEIERLAGTDAQPWSVDRTLRSLLTDAGGNPGRSEFCIDELYDPDSTLGRLGRLELRGLELPPHPDLALVQALLIRALVARFADEAYSAPLVRWGAALHDRFLLPHFATADLLEVVADLRSHGFAFDASWLEPQLDFRFPRIGSTTLADVQLELRTAIHPRSVLAQDPSSGAGAASVDSSTERLQVRTTGLVPGRHLLTCNGAAVPLPHRTPGAHVAAIRYRARTSGSSLHPSLAVDAPLTVELVDRANRASLGGVTYHVVHPGGQTYDRPPVNAKEAEARRASRFERVGRTAGEVDVDALVEELSWRGAGRIDQPLTLDLRRRPPRIGRST